MLLIAAYRPAEVQPGLRDALAGLAALPPTRVSLGGLDAAQAARLIRSVAGVQPDPATLSALVSRTEGNPFYLTESARLVLIDATVVRMVLVPATMSLLGRANWWLPAWLDRLLPHLDVDGHLPMPATGAERTLVTV